MQKIWEYKNDKDSHKPIIERLMAVRGITKKTDVKNFLNPLEMKLSEPKAFCDMQKAVERIVHAIKENQKILVYGDFDADGITSTSILMKTLKHLNASVDYYIPDRENEGHGMNTKTLVKIMTSKKPKVLITVDCGVSNIEEVKFLNSFGIDVILTDHHEAPEELPPAFAIINPKAQNSLDENLSANKIIELTSLAGCGVAFKLAQSLLQFYKKTEFIYELLPLVAVGTVADIVPLIGENRYFVTKGLELISKGQHQGLTKLLKSSGYKSDDCAVTSEDIAFGIAPRINATGRLDNVEMSLKLLLSDNNAELEMAVQTLNELNKVRQQLCEDTFLEAEEMYLKDDFDNNAIVLFNKDWNVGIIGIVASKFVEKYYKPAFIVTYHSESKQYRCSARSVKGIHLYNLLDANAELFDGFGGHEMAAGFSFSEEHATFEQVKNALNETVKEMAEGLDLKPTLDIDLLLDEKDLDITIVDEIKKLEPFGASNPSPVFAIKDFILKEKTLMGENKKHLRLKIQGKNALYTCVWWSHGDISLVAGDKLDVAFSPKINNFNNNTSLQLIVQDIHSENLKDNIQEKSNEVKIFDHREKNNILPQVEDYLRTSKMNVLVFAENQKIIENLKNYKAISKKIVNRQSIQKADSIMFFDYPPTQDILENIIKTVSPRHIHYMACDVQKFDEQYILKTFSGMVKYVCNNKDGIFNIEQAASFLAVTNECIDILMQIFNECRMISIKESNEEFYTISFLNNIELAQVLHSSKFNDFKEELIFIAKFKENMLNMPNKVLF